MIFCLATLKDSDMLFDPVQAETGFPIAAKILILPWQDLIKKHIWNVSLNAKHIHQIFLQQIHDQSSIV